MPTLYAYTCKVTKCDFTSYLIAVLERIRALAVCALKQSAGRTFWLWHVAALHRLPHLDLCPRLRAPQMIRGRTIWCAL
jgi:hypothetical protein